MRSDGTATPYDEEEALYRYCRRCHRKLKSAASMKLGYGPICARKLS